MKIPKCDCGRRLELYLIKKAGNRKSVMINCPNFQAGCLPFVVFDCPADADDNRIFKAYRLHHKMFSIFSLCSHGHNFKLEEIEATK